MSSLPVVYQQDQPPPPTSSSYKLALITGYMQITVAVASVAVGIGCIIVGSDQGIIAVPIWGGLGFYLVAGILGAVTGHTKGRHQCLTSGYNVMSILATITAFVHVFIGCLYSTYSSSEYDDYVVNAVNIASILVGVFEFVVAMTAYWCAITTINAQYSSNRKYLINQIRRSRRMNSRQPRLKSRQLQVVGQEQVTSDTQAQLLSHMEHDTNDIPTVQNAIM